NPLSLGTKQDALAQAFTIGDTRLFGPNMVNSFRLTANRIADGKFEPDSMKSENIGPTGLGVQAFAYSPYTSNFNVTGGFSFSSHRGEMASSIFASDVWKVNQKWTLSYGVRWEPYFPIQDLKGGPIHYDHDAFVKGIRSTVFDTTPPGVFFPGDPGFHGKEGQDIKWTNFSPRL